ncbi:hypothetical protein [Microbacterium suwonense]
MATILFVCTGNICRSPYMQHSLHAMLTDQRRTDVSIVSAGTHAVEGHAMATPLARRLHDRGIDASGFRASTLRSETIDNASLVVTATREHRRLVVGRRHDAAERTFTLAQLARLLRSSPENAAVPASVPDLVHRALTARGRSGGGASDDDLDDPWRRSQRTYRRVADRIDELLIPIAAGLVAGS